MKLARASAGLLLLVTSFLQAQELTWPQEIVAEDGSVIVRSGEVDYGQGSDTIFCQIVAEELGLRYDEIQLITADTFTTPNAGPTSASRVTYVTGNAVLKASGAPRQ